MQLFPKEPTAVMSLMLQLTEVVKQVRGGGFGQWQQLGGAVSTVFLNINKTYTVLKESHFKQVQMRRSLVWRCLLKRYIYFKICVVHHADRGKPCNWGYMRPNEDTWDICGHVCIFSKDIWHNFHL